MSGIQLSSELISDIKVALAKHDPETESDMLFMQYLSAMTGYVLAHQPHPGLDKRDLLSKLHLFSEEVLDQMENDLQKQDSSQQPQQEAAPQKDAFGIWKPE
jgi:hypothetical protein